MKKPSKTSHRDSQGKFTTKTAKTKQGYRAVMGKTDAFYLICDTCADSFLEKQFDCISVLSSFSES